MNRLPDRLPGKHIVLLGVGHTNAHVVRMWGMQPIPDTDLTCVSDNAVATYSGMLPAVLAGQISKEEMEIDLVRLCASVGARLITDDVTRLDTDQQKLHFADRPAIPFDVLSIGIGSVPTTDGTTIDGGSLLRIKPMQTFLERLSSAIDEALVRSRDRELKIVVAGSGVAGMEVSFCLPGFLKNKTSSPFSIHVVTRSDEILDGVIPTMRQRVVAETQRRGIALTTGKSILRVSDAGVHLNDGALIKADLVIWATGASPPELLPQLGLPLDDRGFLATDSTLRSTSQRPVFAVGDTGTILSEGLPKAGVFAVRQGPILWQNIQKTLRGESLTPYVPQRSFLKLLNTGDGRAIGEWKGFGFSGRWVMKLKEYIDSKFMRMYRVAAGMGDSDPMQCRGCGCKLGGDVLNDVLDSVGTAGGGAQFDTLDDAAVIATKSGNSVVASTDFFSSPFDDPYLAGRVVALHSASDLVAMGASVTAALANVVVPEGDPKSQRQGLNDLLEGARREFAAMGASIVGGHTIVGPRWEVGFTVIGEPLGEALLRKQNLQTGDLLYVTKPLGIGVLLAAHMRSQCAAADYQNLIATMLQSQHPIAKIAAELGITAGTDVTGFGLVGHLIEMLTASHKSATLNLQKIPLLSGAALAMIDGIESTLAPDNRYIEPMITATAAQRQWPEYKALFDPQTCGGLLLAVPASQAAAFEKRLQDDNLCVPVKIGTVAEPTQTTGEVQLV